MNHTTPTVLQYMSHGAHTIGRAQPLTRAHAMMREHHIRHLPVLEGGALVGLLSQNDLFLIETLKDVVPAQVTVEEAMSREVYAVEPETPLLSVARTMATRKLGSAVVMAHGRVLGVLTGVDVARALADLLEASSPATADAWP